MAGERTTPRDLSCELLQRELDASQSADAIAAAVQRGFGMFRDCLSSLIGQDGFSALLARALHRTKAQFPSLDLTVVSSPNLFANLAETARRDGASRVIEGAMALMTNLVDLLCTFMGEDLTRRVVERVVEQGRAGTGAPSTPKEGT